jgi:hypothetical protein
MPASTDPSARRPGRSLGLRLLAGVAFLVLLALVLSPFRCSHFVHDDLLSRDLVRFLGVRWHEAERNADTWTVDWSDHDRRARVRAKGSIEFDPGETRILAISPGGYLEMESREGHRDLFLEIKGTKAGLERTWRVDGEEGDDAEADIWLAAMLPEFFRHTGYGAEARASAIVAREGVEGLFAEIDLIPSEEIQARYYLAGLGPEGEHPGRLARFVKRAGANLESDSALARFLRRASARSDFDAAAQVAAVDAAAQIGSDSTKRRLLTVLLERPGLTYEAFTGMMATATGISSDHDQARFLGSVIEVRGPGVLADPAFAKAAETISSDTEMRRLLQKAVDTEDLPVPARLALLETGARITSDTEKRRLLVAFARTYAVEAPVTAPFFAALRTMGSDHEAGRVLAALLEAEELERATLVLSMDTARETLSSDTELSRFLTRVAGAYPLDEPLRAGYLAAMTSLSSDHERERAQKALDRNPTP